MSKIGTASINSTLHLVVIHDGVMKHFTRNSTGNWVERATIKPPEHLLFEYVDCSAVHDELHVVLVTETGIIYHDVLYGDGSWQGTSQLPIQPLLSE